MKKRERLELIKTIVSNHELETQNDLLKLLEKEGVTLTQATISRDMNEIGIVKVPSAKGNYIYGLSKEPVRSKQQVLNHPVRTAILSLSGPNTALPLMMHVEVIPGNSRLLKRCLKEEFAELIFSLIADDDSLLLVAKDQASADTLRQNIQGWIEQNR